MSGSDGGEQVEVVPNQVFIGCPWKTFRPKYTRLVTELVKKYPLSYVIVGRGDEQEAKELLQVIKEKLYSSSFAIFDATGGNANVSLEFGLAEANRIPRAIYLSSHAASRTGNADSAIIADLAGKRRNQYARESQLRSLLSEASTAHNYTKRFEKFLQTRLGRKSKGEKKRARALALKVIHYMDSQLQVRRDDLVQALLADQVAYQRREVDSMIRGLHQEGLVIVTRGRYATVTIG